MKKCLSITTLIGRPVIPWSFDFIMAAEDKAAAHMRIIPDKKISEGLHQEQGGV